MVAWGDLQHREELVLSGSADGARALTKRLALTVDCPICGAPAGNPCVRPRVKRDARLKHVPAHQARWNKANRKP